MFEYHNEKLIDTGRRAILLNCNAVLIFWSHRGGSPLCARSAYLAPMRIVPAMCVKRSASACRALDARPIKSNDAFSSRAAGAATSRPDRHGTGCGHLVPRCTCLLIVPATASRGHPRSKLGGRRCGARSRHRRADGRSGSRGAGIRSGGRRGGARHRRRLGPRGGDRWGPSGECYTCVARGHHTATSSGSSMTSDSCIASIHESSCVCSPSSVARFLTDWR